MPYLGQGPFQEFTNPPTKDSFTGDGSTVAFDMASEVPSASQNALEVFVDNVRQEPGTGKAFTLGVDGSGDTKRITFSAAPANGASIYVINDKTNSTIVAPLQNDLNGTELILDTDGDTSITADTDDRIDFKIANVEHFSFSNSSGDTVIKPMVDAKDILFQQYDGRTLLDINDGGYIAIANGATGSGELRIYEDTDNGTNYSAFKVGAQSADITYILPTADGSSGQALVTNGSGTLSFATAGAITSYTNSTNNRVVTSVDSSTVNSEANLTFDGSTLAVTGAVTVSTNLDVDGTANLDVVDIDGAVQLDATLTVGANDQGYDVILYGDTASANMTWDTSADDLIFNGAAGLIVPDGQFTLGSTAVTSTAAEINLIDGGTSRGTTAVASGDGLLVNDAGTMRMTNVDTVSTYFASHNVGGGNIVTTGALDSGSITSGFGNIDNGASNITSGGLVKLDVDADADDVSGDSATGRLTLGAGEDLNLYHGGTNSYIVNDTGDLILKTGASDEDMIFQGNDGGSAITALTLDMSAAGAAAFNSTVTATGFIIGSANINETELEIIDGATITTTELNLIDGDTARGTTALADGDGILINDAGTMRMTNVTAVKTYMQGGISLAYDDFTVGDAAVNVTTSAGDITIDAQGNDTDIIFKGTDGGADTTFLTIDGSDAGTAIFNHDISIPDNGIVKVGTGDDIRIYHDGTNSYIDNHTGLLTLRINGTENAVQATVNGSVALMYDNAQKFATSSTGITVTGTAIATTDTDTSNTGNVTLDFGANQNFVLTLTGNTTLVNPSTEQVGQSGFIACIQDGTGSRTLSLGTDYETAGGAGITLTSTASATDLIPYVVVAANRILLGAPQLAFS